MQTRDDFAACMGDVARALLGEPNKALSGATQLRFGSRGSLAVDLTKGTWYDHEAGTGGGVLDLVARETGCMNGEAADWLRAEGFLAEREELPQRGRIVATYDYRDEAGALLYQAVRFEPKDFRQRRPDGKGGWDWRVKGVRQVPYRLFELRAKVAHTRVYIVEGEKDVDRLAALGLVATCNAGGAGKWPAELSEHFRGLDVVLLPDNDEPGRAHAETVARNLAGIAERVRVVALPGLPPKGDVSDWIEAGGTVADLGRIVDAAPLWTADATEPKPKKGSRRDVDWLSECQATAAGVPVPNLANVAMALRSDERWKGRLTFDEMAQYVMTGGRPATDADVGAIQEALQWSGLKRISRETVHQAVDLVAREYSFHPVRQYLSGVRWDGVHRIDGWLSAYLGAPAGEYTAAVGKMFLISMCARVMRPGCKADHMLVLEGVQGAGKSSACSILGAKWFSDGLPVDVSDKDAAQHLRGKWLIEIAELEAMSKSEVTAFKSYLTRTEERYRPAYGRLEVHEPRQCVFVGTTNKAAYLRDETGARRFWPVRCGKIDLTGLARNRDQLFAEAVAAYHHGAQWWPARDLEQRLITPEQAERRDHDVWEEAITFYLHSRDRVTVGEIAKSALNLETGRISRADQNRIMAILEGVGWKRQRRGHGGVRYWSAGEMVTQ